MNLTDLAKLTEKQLPEGSVVAVDPGETTGIAHFRDGVLIQAEQLQTKDAPSGAYLVWDWAVECNVRWLVVEEYRVYAWKSKDHSWSTMHTSRLIGGIDTLAYPWIRSGKVSSYKQSAQTAKTFCTDERLEEWGLWIPGKQHARDAIRHACYFSLFGDHAR